MLGLLLWDAGMPLAAYYGMRLAGQSEQVALLSGAMLAALRLTWVALRKRSFDGFAALLASVLAVGLVLSFVSGDATFLLLKESFATAAAGVIVLASAATSSPLVLVAVRAATNKTKRAEIDRLCAEAPEFRRSFRLMSLVWGSALVLEAAIRVPLVFLLPTDLIVGLSLVLLLGVIALLSAWTVWYAGRVQARYEAEPSRHAATSGPSPTP